MDFLLDFFSGGMRELFYLLCEKRRGICVENAVRFPWNFRGFFCNRFEQPYHNLDHIWTTFFSRIFMEFSRIFHGVFHGGRLYFSRIFHGLFMDCSTAAGQKFFTDFSLCWLATTSFAIATTFQHQLISKQQWDSRSVGSNRTSIRKGQGF